MLDFDCQFQYPDGFDLNFQLVADEECTVLLGPSGAGKTTVLSLIAGLLIPECGHIRVDNRTLVDCERGINLPVHKRGVGFVTQTAALFPHMSVRANLEFGRRYRRPGFRDIDLQPVVDVLELGPLLNRKPATLSGGEASRVALGRALASRPAFLLMDEPLSSLDGSIKPQILAYLGTVINQWKIPTIFVTHDRADANEIGDRIVFLDQGRLREDKPVSGVTDTRRDNLRKTD